MKTKSEAQMKTKIEAQVKPQTQHNFPRLFKFMQKGSRVALR